jgi:putative transposase
VHQIEDILHERGIDITHETVRFLWNRFGPRLAKKLKKKPSCRSSNWKWHIYEVFVKINGEQHCLWRAVDQEGTVLDAYVSKKRDKKTARKVLTKFIKKYGRP